MKKVLVLGCTGSIGTSTLNIIRNESEKFSVCGLSAHTKKESLEFLTFLNFFKIGEILFFYVFVYYPGIYFADTLSVDGISKLIKYPF